MDFWRANSQDMQIGHLRQRYLWGPAVDQILAEEDVDGGTPELVKWTLTDHLNTVRDIARYDSQTDTTTVVNHLVYDAYGNVTSETNSAVESLFLFTARPFDPDTGLQNNLNRWYDPSVGRWLSEDPIEADQNLYRYCGNSPVDSVDPLGLWKIKRAGQSKAEATTEYGDTIDALGPQIGLDSNEFREWLTIPSAMQHIHLVTGFAVSPDDIELGSLPLCGGQTFKIPNTMVSVWYGELKGAGKAAVNWWQDNSALRQLGFNVSVADMLPANGLLGRISALSQGRELHGMFITGHGSTTGFGTAGTSNWFSSGIWVTYAQVSSRLNYALGALVIHACYGDNPSARSLVSPNGIFYGVKGVFYPIINAATLAEWDQITGRQEGLWKPGSQGTNPLEPPPFPLLLP
jgi:RHS repeat-associated protein